MNRTASRSEHIVPAALARAQGFLRRVEFGDALLLFYFIVFARSWFWALENFTAWCLTIPLALLGWYFYVATKEPEVERPAAWFWLIVGVPLFLIYALRAPIPDVSFDVWSLRLFHGERGLSGFIYRPDEFFPTSAPFNPAPDMLTAIFRHLLGYRLGTVVNLLVLLWAGTIVDKLLRPYVRNPRLRAVCILLTVWTEHVLFEINNYMVDVLALPLMLEATRLIIDKEQWKQRRYVLIRVAFLVGASVTLKLSNGALALPLILLCAWRALSMRPLKMKRLAPATIASIFVFAAPLLPFMVWVYRLTGSPVFPIYNGYFQSPLYPPSNGWDGRWGGFGPKEILAWPVLIFFEPQRTAEISVYSGRLSIAFLAALVCLVLARQLDLQTRSSAFIIVLGSLLWSLTMGYIRYGLYLEVMSGVFMIAIASLVLRGYPRAAGTWRVAFAALICIVLVAQSALACFYTSREEWSMRPTAFQEFGSFAHGSKYILSDRSIRAWMPEREREMLDGVDVWIVSGSKTAGLMPFLNERAPVLGVRSAGIYTMDTSRRELARRLDTSAGKKMYSLALPEDYHQASTALADVGLRSGRIETILVPIFAPSHLIQLYFFEVTSPSANP